MEKLELVFKSILIEKHWLTYVVYLKKWHFFSELYLITQLEQIGASIMQVARLSTSWNTRNFKKHDPVLFNSHFLLYSKFIPFHKNHYFVYYYCLTLINILYSLNFKTKIRLTFFGPPWMIYSLEFPLLWLPLGLVGHIRLKHTQ